MKTYQPLLQFYNSQFLAKFKKLCEPLAINFGLDAFAYSKVTKDGYFYQISNVPDQAIMYWESDLYEKNLFLQNPDSYEEGIYLLSAISDDAFKEMLSTFEEKGLEWHLRIVRKEQGVCHQFLFGSSLKDLPFSAIFFSNIHVLEIFINYFISESQEIVKNCDPFTFSLRDLLGSNYESKKVRKPAGVTAESKKAFISQIDEGFHELEGLTKRELDCAKELLTGKTARQIGRSLYVSPRTVEHHLENIKLKLFCSSKQELLQKLNLYNKLDIL